MCQLKKSDADLMDILVTETLLFNFLAPNIA